MRNMEVQATKRIYKNNFSNEKGSV